MGYQKLEETTDYWEITVHPTLNEDLFISYPDIPCSSEWIFVREDKGGKIYKEKLVSNFDKCINNGIVLLIRRNFPNLKKILHLPRRAVNAALCPRFY